MEIRKVTEKDLPELIRFGEEAFPKREGYRDIVNFVLKNRIGGYTGGVALFDNKEIKGQSLFTEMKLWFKGKKRISGWGYELIVDQNLRSDAWGVEVLLGSREFFPGTCATGSGPEALKLNLKLGSRQIGEIRKYIGPSSLRKIPLNFLPTKRAYPERIDNFMLVREESLFQGKDYYNFNLVETGRDNEFIAWRYFTSGFKKYHLYQAPWGDWFVSRTIKLKGIDILLLSDFRCNLDSSAPFNEIYRACRNLANKLHLPFILCGSSHRVVDSILERNRAKSFGRPRPILFPKQLREWIDSEKVSSRDFCLITFGDSDGEWNW